MADVLDSEAGWDQRFPKSEWFTRGWTLQELIAPTCVEFYAQDWAPIGTKFERHKEIADITRIYSEVLVRTQEIDIFSAAERLSWAAHRNVTRKEDEAYSFLGLFDVNMPLLYGEGREKAFIRLQEAIYNSTADHSLFLFRHSLHLKDQPLLADSPTRFCERTDCTSCTSSGVQCLPSDMLYTKVLASERWSTQAHEQIMTTVTPFRNEMSTTLPLLDYREVSNKLIYFNNNESRTGVTHVAVLNHTLNEHMKGALCLLLCPGSSPEVFRRSMLPGPFASPWGAHIWAAENQNPHLSRPGQFRPERPCRHHLLSGGTFISCGGMERQRGYSPLDLASTRATEYRFRYPNYQVRELEAFSPDIMSDF